MSTSRTRKPRGLRAWDDIEKAFNEKKPIKGVVVDRIKGGLTVDIDGAQAFSARIASRPASGCGISMV